MKPLTEETEYITMSKDLFKIFVGLSFKGGLLHQLRKNIRQTVSDEQAEQDMIDKAMSEADKLAP
jgi:hypothetical protein